MTPGRLGALPEGRRGQALAVGLLLLCLGLVWIVVAAPLIALHGERAEVIAGRRALAARMAQLAATLPDLRAQAASVQAVGPAQAALLGGATDAVAGATLQQLVLDLAVQAGATPSSTETLAAEQVGAYRRVGVRIALTAPWPVLVRLLFGQGFAPAVEVLRLLAWVLPLVAISQVLGLQLMTPLRMDWRFALIVGVGCVATLGPAVLLTPTYGAAGMAWARIVGETAVVVACLICLKAHWASLFQGGGRRDVQAV